MFERSWVQTQLQHRLGFFFPQFHSKYVSLPSVCGFEAFINGKHIVGQVKEKEQAHREYREAISKGHGAYLMDEETPVSDGVALCMGCVWAYVVCLCQII